MTTTHLELMSKPRLIALVEGAQARIRQERDLTDYWRNMAAQLVATEPKPAHAWSVETTLDEARRILRRLPGDPHAQLHRDELRAALNFGGAGNGARKGMRAPGPRCAKNCDQLLNQLGFCPRCQTYQTRRAMEARA
jgi:hypothetical protein